MVDDSSIRALEEKVAELRTMMETGGVDLSEEIALLEKKLFRLRREQYAHMSDWDRVKLARHPERPRGLPLVEALTEDFYELRGDRMGGDDPALRGGPALLDGRRVMLLFHHRGSTREEQHTCRFGMATPQGYRKALRLMHIAERLHLPVVTLVDTPGAYPGLQSEEQNIAGAIAECISRTLSLNTPSVAVILGEGGSGGAIAIAAADRVLMMENATYSVISPEGAAAILWKDPHASSQAAQALRLTAPHLRELGFVDHIISEPVGGAHTNLQETADVLRSTLGEQLDGLTSTPLDELKGLRYKRYRNAGSTRTPTDQKG
ncbi:MAG: acetyl-CoA carboxylase carboxyltransferase subunit alpha [Candidatus Bipolaricaulota bacterium]